MVPPAHQLNRPNAEPAWLESKLDHCEMRRHPSLATEYWWRSSLRRATFNVGVCFPGARSFLAFAGPRSDYGPGRHHAPLLRRLYSSLVLILLHALHCRPAGKQLKMGSRRSTSFRPGKAPVGHREYHILQHDLVSATFVISVGYSAQHSVLNAITPCIRIWRVQRANRS